MDEQIRKLRRNRTGVDIRDVIADLNLIQRGWGNYFRTGDHCTDASVSAGTWP